MKPGFLALDVSRSQITLAGRVLDAGNQQPLAGAVVTLTTVPSALQARLQILAGVAESAWEARQERPDRTLSAFDGAFRFVNLPAGGYGVTVEVPGGKYQKATTSVTVSTNGAGQIVMKIVNFQIARAS